MIIYCITNLINGKKYVGQSKKEFKDRYDGGKWWKWTGNKHLKNAAQKYGEHNFYVEILARPCWEELLNKCEQHWIERLNCIYPNGYNYQKGGQKTRLRRHHPETRRRMALDQGPGRRELKNSNGKIVGFMNLSAFCRKYKVSRSGILRVFAGTNKQHKGWTLPQTNLWERYYRCPKGTVHRVRFRELRPFCRAFNLHHGALGDLWTGKIMQFKGWTKFEATI